MRTVDKMEVVRLLIETAENSRQTIVVPELFGSTRVVIDAEKFIKRLNVELSLLEKEEEDEAILCEN